MIRLYYLRVNLPPHALFNVIFYNSKIVPFVLFFEHIYNIIQGQRKKKMNNKQESATHSLFSTN